MVFCYYIGVYSSSLWLCSRAAMAKPFSYNHQPLFYFCKTNNSKRNSIFCCTATSTDGNDLRLSSVSSPSSDGHSSSKPEIPAPEILRRWIETDQPLASEDRFIVVSYNILGVKNASKHSYLYRNVPFRYLKWDHRKRLICKELIELDPDIICLQEVDRYFDLLKIMDKAGYAGCYKRCTGDKVDGCAMFWKSDRFQLLQNESIEFKSIGLRDNVAQIFVFETSKEKSRRVLVGNIHVLYNPSKGDVKLGQIRFLLSRAKILAKKWGDIPIVLAGDFNSTPESAIYKFLSSSKLNIMDFDRRDLSGQRHCHPNQVLGIDKDIFITLDKFWQTYWTEQEIRTATGNTNSCLVKHPLKLKSSYATVKGSTRTRNENGEPKATSYHLKFLGTVDYLWYSGGVVPTRVLDTLPFDVLMEVGGLPSKRLGSDHLALVSEFAFTEATKQGDTTFTSSTAAPTIKSEL